MSIRDRKAMTIEEIKALSNSELLYYFADYSITAAPSMAIDHPYRVSRDELLKRLDNK
jgi:hypothetical protein